MGCDIHAFIEYKHLLEDRWSAISGQLYLDRNYGLFSALAGVRSYGDAIDYLEPRGIPDDISWMTESKYTLLVVPGEETNEEGCCTREEAERYLGYGSEIWEETREGSEYYRITGPDWHTPSWLNLGEFQTVYDRYLARYRDEYDERDAGKIPLVEGFLALMDKLEDMGFLTRIVFWFDN